MTPTLEGLSGAQRDEKIIVALRAYGYMARAAYEAGCDARTVRRLIDTNPVAAAAFAVGTTSRLQERLNYRRTQEANAHADFQLQVARVHDMRARLFDKHVGLSHSEMRQLEKEIDEGVAQLKKRAAEVRRARRETKAALSRLEALEPPKESPDV